ncbi:hypothetical protein NHX12_032890 [Muraenolepis orangiensis]|uniref:Impact N-terminal domain-containing protein n=1 Tax=Muraenolepis orangiensis TaxID=630683 RepID=A0A9Q0E1I1_9TELE|nr:hypothetical protein NHX12_032890 [Muraenolepis orangiensis]
MDNLFNSDNAEDLQSQIEEVEALSSIYGEEWCVIDEASRIFCIKIANDMGDTKLTACLQVKVVLDKLCENKKIASATHNIYAYRIYCEDKQSYLQDCEDDGETAAGGRLLHLLQILDVRNVMVVVSRWYGGILLGPDRFKHINNCARNILVQEGYTSSPEEASKLGGKSKKTRIPGENVTLNGRVQIILAGSGTELNGVIHNRPGTLFQVPKSS